jgi:hypothetical protein
LPLRGSACAPPVEASTSPTPPNGDACAPLRHLRHNGGDDRFVLVDWVLKFWHMDSLADTRILAVVVLGS